jgi:DNA gyrase subunit B
MKKYDENSIQVLDERSHVRLRPAMYIGDTGIFGLHHLVYEVVDNSIDEITNGYGDKITCIIHKDGFVTIEDNGRGIPVGTHSQTGKAAAETVLTSLHSGGKFDSISYKTSSGLHGIGVSAVNFLSEQLDLTIYKEGYTWRQTYKKGITATEFSKGDETDKTGTIVKFKPDHLIFQTVEFQYKILYNRLKELAYLNKGVRINLIDEKTSEQIEFYSDGGIKAFVDDLNKDKEVLCTGIYFNDTVTVKNQVSNQQYDVIIEAAFQYNKTYTDVIYSFANNVNTRDGGTHLSGFKSALLDAIVKYAEKKKLFKGLDIRPTPRDILEGLTAIISIKLPNPEFEGQTKSTLGNPEIKEIVYDFVLESITKLFDNDDGLALTIAEKISQACIAREEARKARETVRRKNILSSLSLPGKLADCSSKNADICELFVVEGDCFKADTLVYTADGLKKIVDIKKGDMIYTHMHRYRPAMERKPKIKRKKCRITIQGKTFVCSQDHLWGVLRANSNVCEWVPARELKTTDLLIKTVLPGDEYCKVVDILDFIKGRRS